jgi:NitT/TauT family transport system substrate-binding protein
MKIKKWAIFLGIILALGIVVLTWNWRSQPRKYSGPVNKIRMGLHTNPESSALICVADSRGFFKNHGLDISTKDYQAGVIGMKHLAAGEIDVATVSEFVLANQILRGIDIKAIGTSVRGTFSDLIGRKDHGIEKGTDWKGKKIGSLGGSNLDFFLEGFLNSQGIRMNDVKIIPLTPSEIVNAVIDGTIDGGVSFDPYSDKIKKGLGTNAVSWSVQGRQDAYMLFVAKSDFIKTNPSAIERVLRAMIDAEQFLEEHESEARKIIAERLQIDQSVLSSVWQRSRFNVRLDQDILSLMEDEARWIIRNQLMEKRQIPNYFDSFYLDGLQKVKPEAITIIH